MAIFGDCEEMEDTESLKLLAKLLKNIGTWNTHQPLLEPPAPLERPVSHLPVLFLWLRQSCSTTCTSRRCW